MDASHFDQLARRLAAERTRRRVLGGLAGGMAALLGVDMDESQGKKRGRRKRGTVQPEGPCGNGKGKANRCKRHRQCCTGYCHKRKRCRCRRPGQPCTEDRNCCSERQGMICSGGICQAACPAARQCGDACCAADQTCIDGACQGTCPAGHGCGETCCPSGQACVNGQCQPPCPGGQACGGRCCAPDESCVNGVCQLPCGAGGPCTVFVTSTTHQGNLGGLDGADGICRARAAEAKLSGTFKAWLSDGSGSPATRFSKTSGPYQLVNGATIANDWADLTDGSLAHPIDRTELDGGIGEAIRVFSDTASDGTCLSCNSSQNNCDRWTDANATMGNYGLASASNAEWTNRTNSVNCSGWQDASGENQRYRLYCFQQP